MDLLRLYYTTNLGTMVDEGLFDVYDPTHRQAVQIMALKVEVVSQVMVGDLVQVHQVVHSTHIHLEHLLPILFQKVSQLPKGIKLEKG